MKNWLRFAAALVIGAFVFTACESEVTLSVPGDTTIQLGEEFDPLTGVTVDGGKVEDVAVLWNPAFNKNLVNHYVASYAIEGETAQRNVYVTSAALAGAYAVVDAIDGHGNINYDVTVLQSSQEFNKLFINGFADFNIEVNATINGNAITLPRQTPTGWTSDEYVQATGTYDGEGKRLLTFTYEIRYLDGGVLVTDNGVATYTRK